MKSLSDTLSGLKSLNANDYERIEAIDGDVIGTSLFLNILLSVGAFLTSIFALIFIMSMSFLVLDFSEQVAAMHLAVAAVSMIVAGYMTYSADSLFGLRLSTFFMFFGKAALIALIFERVGDFVGYDRMFDDLSFWAPLAVLLAFANMYIAKIKLEMFLLLFACVSFASFFSHEYNIFHGFIARQKIEPFGYEFWVRCLLWVWVIVMLLKFSDQHKNRLPFYAFVAAQIATSNALIFGSHSGVFELLLGFNLVLVEHVFYNLLLLAPTVFMIFRLQKASDYKLGWQVMACVGLLVVASVLPISNLFIILFCYIYGYAYRDRFILITAYILTPTFIYNLYNDFNLTLDSASLLAMIIGLVALAAWAVVKFTHFEKQEA